jgi:Ca-activated chloride channel family protein
MKTRSFLLKRIGLLVLLTVFVAGLIGASVAGAQQQRPPSATGENSQDEVVKIDTTLVTLPVSVMDRHGKFMMDLRQEQFHIYEDGVEQEIAYFAAAGRIVDAGPDKRPFTVALLLDISDSTQFKLEAIQRAALAFVELLSPEDRVMVVAFDKRIQILAEATNNRNTLRQAIRRTVTGGGTSLYGALDTIINQRLSRVVGRKAVVLLTDGVDTTSKGATADSTLRAAEESDAAIYPVQYNTYGDFADVASRETYTAGVFGATTHASSGGEPASEAYKRANLYLRLLADKTGGRFQYADGAKNLARSFEGIAAQLRQQYTLGYYPKNKVADGAQRQIKVEVVVLKATVRTRKSYIYKPQKN